MRRLVGWLEERTGLPSAIARALDTPPRIGALFGVLLVLLLVQAATGLALSLHYAPTSTDAWASVWYLEHRLPLGALIRGVHHWGTSAMVITVGLHVLLTAVSGRYRKPRELSWWLSLGVLFVLLGFGMTGNPLPWDQHGYWGARVEGEVMASAPVVGPLLRSVFLGGSDLGNLTLTRLHALHVLVLPAILVALLALHRRAVARTEPAPARDPRPRIALLACCALAAVTALAVLAPPGLEAPAEPASAYQASPAWYFLPLNQLLALFPGSLAVLGTAVLPGLAVAFLFALPLLDRGPRPELAARVPWVASVGAGSMAVMGLLGLGISHRGEPAAIEARADARFEAERAALVAAAGVPAEGAQAMMNADPLTRGKRLYARHCAACHTVGGRGTDEPNGPDLAAYLTEPWLRALIDHPRDPRFFGTTEIDEMDPYAEEEPAELAKVTAFLAALRAHPGEGPDELPASLAAGFEAYDEMGCGQCHELEPEEEGAAPNLAGYGSDAWLAGFLREPDGALYYGESNEMPAFEEDELSDEDVAAVIAWLRHLERLPLAPAVPADALAAAEDDADLP